MTLQNLISDPRKALLGQLTLYYIGLTLALYLFGSLSPELASYLYAWEPAEITQSSVLDQFVGDDNFQARQAETALHLLVATLGALLLMLPVTWIYMGTRRRRGLDQSMVESLLVLPIAVSGVVVIVQDSLALAFSLAGIFAGIQFRSKLKFHADAHFLFTSIGVGLAAGIGALHIAAVMSIIFNYTTYSIWRLNYGADSGERHLRFASDDARHAAHDRKVDRAAVHSSAHALENDQQADGTVGQSNEKYGEHEDE